MLSIKVTLPEIYFDLAVTSKIPVVELNDVLMLSYLGYLRAPWFCCEDLCGSLMERCSGRANKAGREGKTLPGEDKENLPSRDHLPHSTWRAESVMPILSKRAR